MLEAALVDELGDEYRSLMAPEMAPPLSSPITRRQVVNPVPQLRRRYATTRDVSYGEMGRRNQLDVWRRADLPLDGKAPVLVQVHGGAWITGNKEQQGAALMAHLAERGWVCVAVNYRLSPKATWPDHIVDVKRALAWVKEHIAEYGGDPDFVAITGGSAGGHLSSLAALTPNVAAFQPGFEDADTTVQAAVPFYGVYDFTNRDGTSRADMEDMLARMVFKSKLADSRDVWEQASSMSWVGPDAPPFFVIHGTNDSLAPVEQARSFSHMLREASNEPVVYAELPRAQHAFDILSSVRTRATVEAVDRFLAFVRTEHAIEVAAAATGRPDHALTPERWLTWYSGPKQVSQLWSAGKVAHQISGPKQVSQLWGREVGAARASAEDGEAAVGGQAVEGVLHGADQLVVAGGHHVLVVGGLGPVALRPVDGLEQLGDDLRRQRDGRHAAGRQHRTAARATPATP